MTTGIAACLSPGDLVVKAGVRGEIKAADQTHCFIKWTDGTYTERRLSDMKDIEIFEFDETV